MELIVLILIIALISFVEKYGRPSNRRPVGSTKVVGSSPCTIIVKNGHCNLTPTIDRLRSICKSPKALNSPTNRLDSYGGFFMPTKKGRPRNEARTTKGKRKMIGASFVI